MTPKALPNSQVFVIVNRFYSHIIQGAYRESWDLLLSLCEQYGWLCSRIISCLTEHAVRVKISLWI